MRAAPAPVEFGTIRGVVYDQDFETPLAGAVVTAVEFRRTAPMIVLVDCNIRIASMVVHERNDHQCGNGAGRAYSTGYEAVGTG